MGEKLTDQHSFCLETLGNRLRMAILGQLERQPMRVTELAACVGAERSTVSHALQQLRQCNLVLATKEGRDMVYSVNAASPVFAGKKGTLFQIVEEHAKTCGSCPKCGR